jgi:hypothetical protein
MPTPPSFGFYGKHIGPFYSCGFHTIIMEKKNIISVFGSAPRVEITTEFM